ncbi:serine hydrolase [Rheinheimera sp. 1928-s]|uniref:serine hydrolase domain-containing protein n=1 Tax=Rheinheimera sp. 1928-s TaxID=3033803 RepID=UPI00260C95E6|nr:serine hydrolase [Rheinheimera sp. 1928-s]MDF3126296.1 serine hydrolase [Rheinheimera sp. 1928-s]
MKNLLQAMLCVVLPFYAAADAVSQAKVDAPKPPCAEVAGGRFDTVKVELLFNELEQESTRDLRGVVISRHGCVQAERYFNGDGPESLRDIRSAAKSITAVLMGIAIEQRLLPGVDEPIAKFLPAGMPTAQQQIRIRDLLTMRSGLDSDDDDAKSQGNEDRLDNSSAWIPFAYKVPLKYAPGERYVYSSLNAFLAGAVVEHVSGMPLQSFAQQHLFEPLGIKDFSWRRGPKGEGVGQGNLSISARDMTKIGSLMLNKGRVGQRQILPDAWVAEAMSPIVNIAQYDPYADSYGYMWYSKQYEQAERSILVHFASGNGGNKIYIVPQYDLVIAVTSTAYGQGYGQRRSEHILLQLLDAVS